MKGHVRRRGQGWAFVVDAPRGSDGKRRQRGCSRLKTKKEAEKALVDAIKAVNDGTYVEPSRQTVVAFFEEEWLPAARGRLCASTWASYRMNMKTQVVPRIGGVSLQSVAPAALNKLYADLRLDGRRDGRGLSARSVRHVHAIIRKPLADAMRWGKVTRNVADLADPPKSQAERASRRAAMKAWSTDAPRAFLAHVANDRLAGLWTLAAMSGMRRGELAGLLWRDVDLDAVCVAVTRGLVSVDYALAESETESGKVRVIDLDPATVAAHRAHRKRQAEERLAWGPVCEDHGLVFAREDGSSLHPEQLTCWFKAHAKEAKLPAIRLHDLRHTHATLLVHAETHPKVVQERLGHHFSAFTMDTYAHAMPAMQVEAPARLASLIAGAGRG